MKKSGEATKPKVLPHLGEEHLTMLGVWTPPTGPSKLFPTVFRFAHKVPPVGP
jgi:hypothetical protein